MSQLPMKKVLRHLRRAVLRATLAPTDGELLEDFLRQRNDASFEGLIERHGPMVWSVCQRLLRSRHDAEDAYQATFLVFLRKAECIFPREMIGNWLYGVARQTALNARALAVRRKERLRDSMHPADPAVEAPAETGEERLLLDQELGRLPANYRSVIVLCELEGQTRKEAARQLKVPEGTIAGWLARAKALLAKRLTRRGLAVSVGTVAVLLAQSTARCAAPRSLIEPTIRAASLLAAGQNATGVASPDAVALSEGVIRIMFASKLKTISALVLAPVCGIFLIASVAQTRGPTAPQAESTAAVAAQVPAPQADKKQVDPNVPQEEKPPLQEQVPPAVQPKPSDFKTPLPNRTVPPGAAVAPPYEYVPAQIATAYGPNNRLGAQLAQPGEALIHQLDLPAEQGQVVHSILLESAAADAGMKNYDILLELGGKKVSSHPHDFMKVLNEFKTGVPLDAVVVRKTKKMTIKGVTLPKAPSKNLNQNTINGIPGMAPGAWNPYGPNYYYVPSSPTTPAPAPSSPVPPPPAPKVVPPQGGEARPGNAPSVDPTVVEPEPSVKPAP